MRGLQRMHRVMYHARMQPEAYAVLQVITRRNHVGQFTATLVLPAGSGRVYGHGATKADALASAFRKRDALEAIRTEVKS